MNNWQTCFIINQQFTPGRKDLLQILLVYLNTHSIVNQLLMHPRRHRIHKENKGINHTFPYCKMYLNPSTYITRIKGRRCVCVCISICHLGDWPIGPSPRPTNRSTDWARGTRARPIQPREGHNPRACVSWPSLHEPKRPRESQPTPRAPTHATQLFSVLAQLFGSIASHFLVSLSHLVIVNSTIFGIVNSVIFIYNELSHFSYRAQSFYDFISHTATANSSILLEKSAIFATMNWVILLQWTQSFFTTTVLSHSSSYSAQSFFVATLLSHFPLLIAQLFFYYYNAHPFFTTTVLTHSSCKRSSIIHRCYST
jgi:hypothetical protein